MEFTYDENDKPLSVTFQGETFWYVYNGHGDVVALTDKNGEIAARYEYDEWGLSTKMYNRFGERVREGIGWIGDLGTGNGTPGSRMEETNTDEIDQHPGNGNAKGKDKQKNTSTTDTNEGTTNELTITDNEAGTTEEKVETNTEETTTDETTIEEPTPDITTDLVKENPYRYVGYFWDRKTQNYYLQHRYYNPRLGRFISLDTMRGDVTNPLSLNRYVYSLNNPINYVDPTGNVTWSQLKYFFRGFRDGFNFFDFDINFSDIIEVAKLIKDDPTKAYDLVKGIGKGYVDPFVTVWKYYYIVNFDKPRPPTDKEVFEYGEGVGGIADLVLTVAMIVAGGSGAIAGAKKIPGILTKAKNAMEK